jgi:hypothetical protein
MNAQFVRIAALVAPQPEGIPHTAATGTQRPAGVPSKREMRMKTIVAVYSVTVGVLMLVLWGWFWATGAIPELTTKPWEIAMHLTAEFTTAGLLIASGMGLWFGARWAMQLNVFASGMLVYSLIQSPGYYLQKNAMLFVAVFAAAFFVTVVISPAFKPQQPTS